MASLMSVKNLKVLFGCFAALDTVAVSGAVAISSTETVIKLRTRCFDLRTLRYSYQSNK